MKSRNFYVPALTFLSATLAFAGRFDGELNPVCQAGTLASYISNEAGCSIGIIDFQNFSFNSSGNQTPLDAAEDIYVNPQHYGFSFTQTNGQPFKTLTGEFADYQILYDFAIDPAPIIDGGDLALDPPSGGVTVTQYYCNDGVFAFFRGETENSGPLCVDQSQETQPADTTFFTPEILRVTPESPDTGFVPFGRKAYNFGSVLTDISLNGPAQFDAVQGDAFLEGDVPEPSTMLLGMIGVGLIAWRRKARAA